MDIICENDQVVGSFARIGFENSRSLGSTWEEVFEDFVR